MLARVCRPSGHAVSFHLKAVSSYHGSTLHTSGMASAAVSPPVGNTSTFLRNLDNGAEIFLVGTAHVSRASSEEVRDMIHAVKPQTVFVELDAKRAQSILMGGQENQSESFFKRVASSYGNIPGELLNQGMKGFYKMLKTMGMDPGLEFKVALEEAEKLRARIVYGDQDQAITLKNMASALSFTDVLKIMTGRGIQMDEKTSDMLDSKDFSSLAASVEALKTRKAAQAMTAALRQFNPKLAKALIDDRDKYMVKRLRKLEGRVVGVVGLGHLDGIEREWNS